MIWIKIAIVFMFLAVALGAFGAHALRGKLDAPSMDVYRTAVLYQFIHALGLFVVAGLSLHTGHPARVAWAGRSFVAGIILFSGSLYLLSVTGNRKLGLVTPLGGLCFLAGWALLFLSVT